MCPETGLVGAQPAAVQRAPAGWCMEAGRWLRRSEGLQAELFLIESNRYRIKTDEVCAREYRRILEIETILAKERQREHAGTAPGKSLGEKNPQVSREPKARDKAAEPADNRPS